MSTASVLVTFDMTDEQLIAARRTAAQLDALNLGSEDPPEAYSAAEALARILATYPGVTGALIPRFTEGYTAEEVDDR